ncbi:alpha/beta hydrolase [Telmatobacter sp. DSM 110680]|uniref:Alpha/beta hydrolase n=1 Tax=Telmatobacter sp. DSM 110680 TaxID=3036704 RepID=A0AAU7DIY0_9BACT
MSNAKTPKQGRAPVSSRTSAKRPSGSQGPSPPTVSAKWLLTTGALCLAGALICAWSTLCILFWQGSWQLLYHPSSAITSTPASANLPFESVGFATDAAGEPQLRGWWIPAPQAKHTAVYLHGADGNLGDSVNALARLHDAGLNVFAFDYRGYGQSHFAHPSEARWREDAEAALGYLTGTRHIPANAIVLVGRDLGANLALEVAGAHADLAGVVLEQPIESPTTVIFNDPRAHLVPAHLLANDRWQTTAAAGNLLIPSLWFYWTPERNADLERDKPEAYERAPARKVLVWLTNSSDERQQFESALTGWLDQLKTATR